MIRAYETYMYKTAFDEAHIASAFMRIAHDVIHIQTTQPTVAACALFSHYGVDRDDGLAHDAQ